MATDVSVEVEAKVTEILFTEGYEPSKWGSGNVFHDFLEGDIRVDSNRLKFHFLTGGEAEGEYADSVFTIDGVYYKAVFRYFSHHGFDFSYLEVYEVTPKEKTITVYDPI